MRFYDLTVGNLHWTSLGGSGASNPGALNVEVDVTLKAHDAGPNAYFRVWGPGLDVISQAQDLYGKDFKAMGGMSAGLPLANPAQQGVICSGKVWKAFGNWQGVDQTLDLIVSVTGVDATQSKPGPNPVVQTKPIVFNAPKGTPFKDAIETALKTAYPDLQTTVNIDSGIKAMSDQIGYHSGIEQFAFYLRRYSQMLTGGQGISLHTHDGTINAFDGSQQTQGGQIAYTDLIGQPTWIDVGKMQIKCPMRADIHVGDTIMLPQTLVTNTASGGSAGNTSTGAPQTSLTFQGSFQVDEIHHLGNFRQPDANSWVTVINGFTTSSSSSSGGQTSDKQPSGTY